MTTDAEVIVAGAGPAGAAAARALAAAGVDVILCDRSRFPRDKACGDGLIPDALAALGTMGLADAVRARAHQAPSLRVLSPSGIEVEFRTPLQVVPRVVLDHLLVQSARDAGARFRHVTIERPIVDGSYVAGIVGTDMDTRAAVELRAPLTVLATGGAGRVLAAFDSTARVRASGTAVRTYAVPAGAALDGSLWIALEPDLLPGYAWAFPAPGHRVNVGVGTLSDSGHPSSRINLRRRLDQLVAGGGVLGRRVGRFADATPYLGAPLRTGLTGATLGQPGLAIIGEAAGTTYSISGEGIGKALESGLLVGEMATRAPRDLAQAGLRYAAVMQERHAARFRSYARAQKLVARAWVADYVARRANESPWLHRRLTGIITERELPSRVFSARALWHLLVTR